VVSDLTPGAQPPAEHLLRDCLALGAPAPGRTPAKLRLEAVLGAELAQRLVKTLTIGSRGHRSAGPRHT